MSDDIPQRYDYASWQTQVSRKGETEVGWLALPVQENNDVAASRKSSCPVVSRTGRIYFLLNSGCLNSQFILVYRNELLITKDCLGLVG